MRILILLLLVMAATIVILALQNMRLKRQIAESDNPLLALTRKERRQVALDNVRRETFKQDFAQQEQLNRIIYPQGFKTET